MVGLVVVSTENEMKTINNYVGKYIGNNIFEGPWMRWNIDINVYLRERSLVKMGGDGWNWL
jgi:hypothetical protein